MGVRPNDRHYFAEGITNRGYISLLPHMMLEWDKAYILMGGPGTGKSTLIKMIGLDIADRGYEVDFMRSAWDPDSIAGILMRKLNWAILDNYEVAPSRWRAPGLMEEMIDFASFCNKEKLEEKREEILEITERIAKGQRQIGEILATDFSEPLREKSNSSYLKEEEKPWLPKLHATDLFKNKKDSWSKAQDALKKIQKSIIRSYFLHGLGTEGWVNLAPSFLQECDQIRIEGEEAHEAMEWILQEAESLGQVIDIVLHPIYPDETLGIVLPERNLAIWQGDPACLKEQGLDKVYSISLKEALYQTKEAREHLKALYTETVDFDKVDALRADLLNCILRNLDK